MENKRKPRVITTPESFNDEDNLRESINQAIGNTEILLPMIQTLQAEVADLKRRISDLESAVHGDG